MIVFDIMLNYGGVIILNDNYMKILYMFSYKRTMLNHLDILLDRCMKNV